MAAAVPSRSLAPLSSQSDGKLRIGADGGLGFYTQNGGTTTVANNKVILGEYDSMDSGGPTPPYGQTPGSGTLTLTAGVFQTTGITTSSDPLGAVTGTAGLLNFNGGTLRALGNSSDFITIDNPALASMTLSVKAGGAVIDTNTYAVTINQPFANGTGGIDGGVAKAGAGTLILTAINTYNGPTAVTGGTLRR